MTNYEKDYQNTDRMIKKNWDNMTNLDIGVAVNHFVSRHPELEKDYHNFTDPFVPIGIVMDTWRSYRPKSMQA